MIDKVLVEVAGTQVSPGALRRHGQTSFTQSLGLCTSLLDLHPSPESCNLRRRHMEVYTYTKLPGPIRRLHPFGIGMRLRSRASIYEYSWPALEQSTLDVQISGEY